MLGVKVPKANAERARKYLAGHKLAVNNYMISRDDKFIYFPIRPAEGGNLAKWLRSVKAVVLDREFRPAAARKEANRSYDIIGDIAIIDADTVKAAKAMAGTVMKINKNVKTVLAKAGPVSGRYRIRKYRHVAGAKKYEAVYKENGCAFNIDVRKAFFSPRLAYERKRVCSLVGKKENVMVMFAGIGPFAIEIAKAHRDSKVVGIELNKEAYRYMVDNIRLNRTPNVTARLGDVNAAADDYRGFADRIIMPLPKDSYGFLDAVGKIARKGCTVHYYAFGNKDTGFRDTIDKLKSFFKSRRRKIRILFKREVRTYSASEIEVVIDFVLA